ncbi:MAG TPA: hypothetical protein IGS52_24475 [Oscillatoriaceae cyanobacterium M33_DOE_052]|uniref:Uncharacterized protein n=1 Tax=Planktothricoides sp. SpSt-374 TaxID=2282167 RepID=A0A7C3VGY6_9CYAN|nr:hypothetical protein [Oscillatoriaceae cyanobacterium M33_DOE_052]
MELKSKSGQRGSLSLTENASNRQLYLLLEEPKFVKILALILGAVFALFAAANYREQQTPKNLPILEKPQHNWELLNSI